MRSTSARTRSSLSAFLSSDSTRTDRRLLDQPEGVPGRLSSTFTIRRRRPTREPRLRRPAPWLGRSRHMRHRPHVLAARASWALTFRFPCPSHTLVVVIPHASGHANFWTRLLSQSATKTFPLPSTATPTGTLNCPSPLPVLPHLLRKVPVSVNFWMRLLPLPASATKTFALASAARAKGQLNCPSPLPRLPHLVRKVPVFVNFWMRRLLPSATKTFTIASTVRIKGLLVCELLNCPSPLPALPHFNRNCPQNGMVVLVDVVVDVLVLVVDVVVEVLVLVVVVDVVVLVVVVAVLVVVVGQLAAHALGVVPSQ